MKFIKFKRKIAFFMVLIMVLSAFSFQAIAAEETISMSNTEQESRAENEADTFVENTMIFNTQQEINRILYTYLGSTTLDIDEMEALVNIMEWETYQTARYEISLLDEALATSMENGEVSESEIESLINNNILFCEFSSALEEKARLDNEINLLATTIDILDGNVSITDSVGTGKINNGTVTITAKGGIGSTTNTITIINETENTATLSFDYSVSNAKSHTFPANSDSYSVILDAGASVSFTITSKALWGTVTLTMSNFNLVEAASSSNVTFEFDSSLGNIKVGGSAVSDGDVKSIGLEGTALEATTKTGATFLGWVDGTNKLLSTSTSYTLTPTADMTVGAVFVDSSSKGWFKAGGDRLFDDLNEAATYAKSKSDKLVILMNSSTLSAGDYTIPSGVTLLIPFDSSHTLYTTKPSTTGTTYTKPTAYRTLTMAEGAHIIVNGSISLSAKHTSGSGGKTGTGAPSGPCSFVKMESGSSITINNAGALYAYGFITGDGTILAKSGSTIYENFQVQDWRGGDGTTSLKDVFPISQYFMQNIEVPLTLEAGAKEFGYTSVTVSVLGDVGTEVPFLGSSGAMFNITTGSITKKYEGTTDRLVFEINGKMELAPVTLTIGIYPISSKKYDLAINGNISIRVKDGGSVSIQQDIALLPGTQVVIEQGATCTLGKGYNMYVYDADEWGGYCGAPGATFYSVNYAPGQKYTRTEADLVDAMIQIDGSADASQGYVYTTAGGANIFSTGNGQINLTAGTETVTYQNAKNSSKNTEIPITPAKLLNGDDSGYVNTVTASYYYNAEHERWVASGHTISELIKDATCTEDGSKVYTCSCGGYSYTEVLTSTGHKYESSVTNATCTTAGYITYICYCGNTYKEETEAALGHTEVIDAAKEPTYTETGLTEGKHCSVCGEVTVPQTEIPKLECEKHQYTQDNDIYCDICNCEAKITEKGRTLSYEDYIYVVDIFELSNLDNVENLNLSEDAGILVGTTREQVSQYNAEYANPGLIKYVPGAEDQEAAGTGSLYFGVSDGIMTKELHQTLYLVGYVKLPNGQYIYSSVLEYSPSTYAYNMIEKYEATPDNNTYKLCVALLNYISAAQSFFETGGTLVNEGLKNINDKDLTVMPETWDESTSPELRTITGNEISSKGVNITASDLFQTVENTKIGNNLLFEKMLSIAALYQVDSNYITKNNTSKCGTIIWTQEQWDQEAAANVSINAKYGVKVPLDVYTNDVKAVDSQWYSLIPEKIAAKDMVNEKYYFLGYIVQGEDVHYSGVKVYTVEQYIHNKVNSTDTEAAMVELAKRLYFYERAANAALIPATTTN